MINVYLAHPITTQTEKSALMFDEVVRKLSVDGDISFIDPSSYGLKDDTEARAIVHRNKVDILKSDLLLADLVHPSLGVCMEIQFAHMNGVHVLAVVPEGARLSAWLLMHANFITSRIDVAIDHMKGLRPKEING